MKLIIANWKMNKTPQESVDFIDEIKDVKNSNKTIICPPFVSISYVLEAIKDTKILLGAQNMHNELKGAFTGEISPTMLKSIGCKYVILGHSERRRHFNETDDFINLKIKSAQKNGLIPIVCLGETLEERNNNKTKDVIKKQINTCLKDVDKNIIIAYEPIWAIGTGKQASPEQVVEVHNLIKGLFDAPVVYGGSVNGSSAKGYLEKEVIDGVLVGGASLDPKSFSEIMKQP
ncbi:triose-phosphate isomerase [Nanoarchaeota archaeon]